MELTPMESYERKVEWAEGEGELRCRPSVDLAELWRALELEWSFRVISS